MILAFDPSSSAIGFAVSRSGRGLVTAGVIRPGKRSDPYLERLPGMVDEARDLIVEFSPAVIVIEMPGRHAKKAGGQTGISLAMYGAACGAIWQLSRGMVKQVVGVDSGKWSTVSKETRCMGVRAQFPAYGQMRDPGMDVSDAIALGQWWWERNKLMESEAV